LYENERQCGGVGSSTPSCCGVFRAAEASCRNRQTCQGESFQCPSLETRVKGRRRRGLGRQAASGPTLKLSSDQKQELVAILEAGLTAVALPKSSARKTPRRSRGGGRRTGRGKKNATSGRKHCIHRRIGLSPPTGEPTDVGPARPNVGAARVGSLRPAERDQRGHSLHSGDTSPCRFQSTRITSGRRRWSRL